MTATLVKKHAAGIVIHNPNICLYLDSFVLLLKEGKVLNSGKAKDIINVETLKQIYGDVITTSEELNYNEITFKQC